MEYTNLSQDKVRLNRLHWPVTVLGYGKRAGLWLQGCSIQCAGCCSKDTWETGNGLMVGVETVFDWVASLPTSQLDGVTITGGEPFDQPDALKLIAIILRQIYGPGIDILVYSGHPWRYLRKYHFNIIKELDVVISEPYIAQRPGALLRGSNNQKIHLLTNIAKARYGKKTEQGRSSENNMQISFDGAKMWLIGIPRPGDLDRLKEKLESTGVMLGDLSW